MKADIIIFRLVSENLFCCWYIFLWIKTIFFEKIYYFCKQLNKLNKVFRL